MIFLQIILLIAFCETQGHRQPRLGVLPNEKGFYDFETKSKILLENEVELIRSQDSLRLISIYDFIMRKKIGELICATSCIYFASNIGYI